MQARHSLPLLITATHSPNPSTNHLHKADTAPHIGPDPHRSVCGLDIRKYTPFCHQILLSLSYHGKLNLGDTATTLQSGAFLCTAPIPIRCPVFAAQLLTIALVNTHTHRKHLMILPDPV